MFLSTKLYPPPLRPGLIRRAALLARLDQGLALGRVLTLVSAPAGYGKTMLVRAWLEGLTWPYTWLALDRSDNFPAQFLAYLVAALQRVNGRIGVQLKPAEAGAEDLTSAFETLINDINAFGHPFVLVLDDYQAITDIVIQAGLAFLLDHLPGNLHLVLITRQDPLLRLSKYRSRGQMTELRLSDLRFTQAEVAAYLNEVMGLGLDAEQVASLAARTEGWAAGLQLAGVSLLERPAGDGSGDERSRAGFIQNFTGDDRYVMDYLMDEVLSLESETAQRFLLYTSVLKQMCAPLCDALLAEHAEPGDSQAQLERLERSNQFIIPLDHHRQWYRYHHLFGDLLHSRLQSSQPELLPELHRRASGWYESAGFIAEAIDHALLSEDFGRAVKLIEGAAPTTIWSSGDLPALLRWSIRLPEDALSTRPRLALYYARALFFSGQIETAAGYLESVRHTLLGPIHEESAQGDLLGVLHTNQATFAAMRGEVRQAIAYASQAAEWVSDDDLSGLGRIGHALGTAHHLSGQYRAAQEILADALHQAELAANRNLGLDLAGCLALAMIERGRLAAAQAVCTQALDAFEEAEAAPPACAVYLAQARLAFEQGNLELAQTRSQVAGDLALKAGWTHVLWRVHALQAQLMAARGDAAGVEQTLWRLDQLLLQYSIPWIERLAGAYRARLALRLGDQAVAGAWSEDYENEDAGEVLPVFEELTLAEVYLTQGRPQAALHILDLLDPALQTGDGTLAQVELGILRARALWRLERPQEARDALSQAALKASPDSLVRSFLDHKDELRIVVESWLARARPPFLAQLLESAPDALASGQAPAPVVTPVVLVEPLSARELEVLSLIAEGMTNPEIAARLYLSVNTLRAHTTHIYQKLDVHNRVQAVSRARQLGLLPKI
jgi:LuxR family transcriptional regulator, maltose regulon positive regulatory protein